MSRGASRSAFEGGVERDADAVVVLGLALQGAAQPT